jgi:hypothetical protein
MRGYRDTSYETRMCEFLACQDRLSWARTRSYNFWGSSILFDTSRFAVSCHKTQSNSDERHTRRIKEEFRDNWDAYYREAPHRSHPEFLVVEIYCKRGFENKNACSQSGAVFLMQRCAAIAFGMRVSREWLWLFFLMCWSYDSFLARWKRFRN